MTIPRVHQARGSSVIINRGNYLFSEFGETKIIKPQRQQINTKSRESTSTHNIFLRTALQTNKYQRFTAERILPRPARHRLPQPPPGIADRKASQGSATPADTFPCSPPTALVNTATPTHPMERRSGKGGTTLVQKHGLCKDRLGSHKSNQTPVHFRTVTAVPGPAAGRGRCIVCGACARRCGTPHTTYIPRKRDRNRRDIVMKRYINRYSILPGMHDKSHR